MIFPSLDDRRKADFVVQECLNRGTRELHMVQFVDALLPHVDPTKRFPNLKFVESESGRFVNTWRDCSDDA